MTLTSYELTDGKEPVSTDEINFLKDLADTLPDGATVIQIGAATGVMTLALLEERPDLDRIYSVDIDECRAELENVVKGEHDAGKVVRVLGDSKAIGPDFPHQADLLIIDGDHFGAAYDLVTWVDTGHVKPGGILACHDFLEVNPPENPGDVFAQVMTWHSVHEEYELLGRIERLIAFRAPA